MTSDIENFDPNTRNRAFENEMLEQRRLYSQEIWLKLLKMASQAALESAFARKDFYISLSFVRDGDKDVRKPVPFIRHTCPTPLYNQAAFKYNHRSGDLQFLWNLPSEMRYWQIFRNKEHYLAKDDEIMKNTCKFIILHQSGELFNWVIKENKEENKIMAGLKLMRREA
jgi:hypothetical protein